MTALTDYVRVHMRTPEQASCDGRDAERAAIVAWLTTKTVAYGEQPDLGDLIDRLVRGEHHE